MSPETLYTQACKTRLAPSSDTTVLDRDRVLATLPHRPPFLFIDRVTLVQKDPRRLVATYTLPAKDPVLAGHFPTQPIWPGVLRIEAIGQAGILLHQLLDDDPDLAAVTLTQVVDARFSAPIGPGDTVELIAWTEEDGLFFNVVGQCLCNGVVAAAAHLRGVI